MARKYIGVDIGSTAVRAVQLGGVDADGFAVIERFAVAPLRADAVVAGRIRNVFAVAQAVRRALDQIGAKRTPVIFGANIPEAAVARLAIQAEVKPQDRLRVIRTLGLQVTPAIQANDAVLAASFIREETTGDERHVAALVVGATTREDIDTILEVAKTAKVSVHSIDLAAAGTVRALVRDLATSRDHASVVDIGATSTTVAAREGLFLRAVRSVPGGGLDLTRALMNATKESFADAERRKYGLQLPSSTTSEAAVVSSYGELADEDEEYLRRLAAQTSAEQALGMAAESLVDQIAQAVEVDTQNSGSLTRHVALCGGTSLTRGLKDRLQRRLGVEVRIGHPWARLADNKHNRQFFINGREDPRVMLSLVTACGLALGPEVAE